MLQFAPCTYYASLSRPPSQRSRDDAVLKVEIARVHKQHHDVYGAEKVWWQLEREEFDVGRDRVARLMRELGLKGVRRGGYKTVTTTSDPEADRPRDLVNRDFSALSPNRLWVADITYVWTWEGFAYTAFVTDVFFRMIVGWRVGTSLATDLPLSAMEMAIWSPRGQSLDHLVHHSALTTGDVKPPVGAQTTRRSTPSTPGAPLFPWTFIHASQTRRLSISNDFSSNCGPTISSSPCGLTDE